MLIGHGAQELQIQVLSWMPATSRTGEPADASQFAPSEARITLLNVSE
jgi:hypothetical protein